MLLGFHLPSPPRSLGSLRCTSNDRILGITQSAVELVYDPVHIDLCLGLIEVKETGLR